MKKPKTARRNSAEWEKAIAPFIPMANSETHGGRFKADVLVYMAQAGEDVSRQSVWLWLNADPENRPEPKYGNGVALLDACRKASKLVGM